MTLEGLGFCPFLLSAVCLSKGKDKDNRDSRLLELPYL
jgi:hypothetical protein